MKAHIPSWEKFNAGPFLLVDYGTEPQWTFHVERPSDQIDRLQWSGIYQEASRDIGVRSGTQSHNKGRPGEGGKLAKLERPI